jgi:hypothetical protein
MTLLYTLELLLFSVALTQSAPCNECFKATYVGGSTYSYFISYTHQLSGCYLGKYTPQVCIHSSSSTGSPRVWETKQVIFAMGG